MSNSVSQRPIAERFSFLLKVLSSDRFLAMQGMGNEVPFFICPYAAQEAVEMEKLGRQLQTQLGHQGIRVQEVDLCDLSIELLKERGIWERVLEMESAMSKAELKELLQNVLDPEAHLVPAIGARISQKEYDILFLSGVGEVFPYIRSHTVLNNLQSVAGSRPMLMFFPGTYQVSPESGSMLVLFDKLKGDQYYRAFNIYQYQI